MENKTIQIKNRYTEEVIFECEAKTIKEAVEEAVNSKANLSEANLWEANLSKANLSEANLWEADLSEANLSKANLWKADLSEANLSKANLSEADLSEADLNCVFFQTKITLEQRKYITEESDLFSVADDSSSQL